MNMIAEGYYAVKCVCEINKKYKVNMPIVETVNNIIYNHKSAMVEMELLAEMLS